MDFIYNLIITYGLKVIAAIVVLIVGIWIIKRIVKVSKKSFENRSVNTSL